MTSEIMRAYIASEFIIDYDDTIQGYVFTESGKEAKLKEVRIGGFDKSSSIALKYDYDAHDASNKNKQIFRLLNGQKEGVNRVCDAVIIEMKNDSYDVYLIELKSDKLEKIEIWEKFTVSRELTKSLIAITDKFESNYEESPTVRLAYVLYSTHSAKRHTNSKPWEYFRDITIYHEYVDVKKSSKSYDVKKYRNKRT
jgi:hypothetical protein